MPLHTIDVARLYGHFVIPFHRNEFVRHVRRMCLSFNGEHFRRFESGDSLIEFVMYIFLGLRAWVAIKSRQFAPKTSIGTGVAPNRHRFMKVIAPFTSEATLKRRVRKHLSELGFTKDKDGALRPPDTSKETYRHLHRVQRQEKLARCEPWLEDQISKLKGYFAEGSEIDPARISPALQEISGNDSKLSYLFRLASLTWSIPVSNGYGRRMRFLVWDRNNGKLIGLIGLSDPVFNMNARDKAIGWTSQDRSARLVNVMDACVLGAIPPYNQLLCSKLVACLVRTKEIEKAFSEKYGETRGIISGVKKHARLVSVTTTSALGRSSVYNRLKLDGLEYFTEVGFTAGWGHFQIPDALFRDLRAYLKRKRHRYANGHQYGNGPNWRIRVARAAFDSLGINSEILRHNLERQVFICSLADNAYDVLRTKRCSPTFSSLRGVDGVAQAAIDRWVIARAEKRPEFRNWNVNQTFALIRSTESAVANLSLEAVAA